MEIAQHQINVSFLFRDVENAVRLLGFPVEFRTVGFNCGVKRSRFLEFVAT